MGGYNQELSADERLAWLRLLRSEHVGPALFGQLLQRYGSAERALAALPELTATRGQRRIRVCSQARAEAELRAAEACGARLLARPEAGFPAALAALSEAPPLLYVRGDPALLQRPAVAIVGARNASANGRRLACELAAALAESGLVVVSGLARGIDAAAHEGALAGGTVAVLAGGVDHVYPPEHDALYRSLCAGGAVLSERAMGHAPHARDFPRRNRLISGLSLGVVVVEAALRSGSLITARLALEQGREVFAVPGSPRDPRARGCNRLIRDGAVLTESADDVVDVLAPMVARSDAAPAPRPPPAAPPAPAGKPDAVTRKRQLPADNAQAELVGLLGPAPVEVDELIRQVQLTPAEVITILLELEMAGRIQRHPGNRVSIC